MTRKSIFTERHGNLEEEQHYGCLQSLWS